MASDATGTRSVHNTLTSTTVDTVTLQGHWVAVEVINRTAAGGAAMWITVGKEGDPVGTVPVPTAAGNENHYVPAGTSVVVEVANGASVRPLVKILGNGNDYSVVGLSTPEPTRSVLV